MKRSKKQIKKRQPVKPKDKKISFSEITSLTLEDLSSLSMNVAGLYATGGCDTTHASGVTCAGVSC